MAMRRLNIICLLALSAVALVALPSLAAGAAKKKASKPQISRVTPMRLKIGSRVTVRGHNFKGKAGRNTVIFRGPKHRSVLVKPVKASGSKLVLMVPGTVAKLAGTKPTRFKLQVLTGRISRPTSKRLSPVIVPVGCKEGDYDGDLLPGSFEISVTSTNPCLKDTDGDGVEDGFEYKSAVDLNNDEFQDPNESLPFPGKRPYPNPLSAGDKDIDFDGDSLTLSEEQALWKYSGGNTLDPLSYSDGEQASVKTVRPDGRRTPGLPAGNYSKHASFVNWAVAHGYRTVWLSDGPPWYAHDVTRHPYGLFDLNRDGTESATEQQDFDLDHDGYLQDDERDEDGDGLTNYEELHGRIQPEYWTSCYAAEAPFPIQYAGTSAVDADSDGDGVLDGADDQDHDDIPNLMELSRYRASGLVDWDLNKGTCAPAEGLDAVSNHPDAYGRVNPFNPCLPAAWSRTCTRHPTFSGAGAPFDNSPNWYSLN
jgi:hypothetical protein